MPIDKISKEDLGSYREVSSTFLVIKVLQNLLKSHIEKHLDMILYDSQHGLIKGTLFQTNLSVLLNILFITLISEIQLILYIDI